MKKLVLYIIKKNKSVKDKYYNAKFHFLMWLHNVDASGVNVSKGYPIVDIRKGAEVTFGHDIWINNYHNTSWYANTMIHVGPKGKLSWGSHSGANGALIFCNDSITIGEHVNIGGGTRIYDTDFHPIDWKLRRKQNSPSDTKTAPVVIEDDVFIGTNCIIGKGRRIGARSVIAAGSVVTKDIPADCIAGGNPCKVIKLM